jgi:hypothetical protein
MRWKLLDKGPPATHVVIMATGDEVTSALGRLVREQKIDAGLADRDRRLRTRYPGLFRLGDQKVPTHPGR